MSPLTVRSWRCNSRVKLTKSRYTNCENALNVTCPVEVTTSAVGARSLSWVFVPERGMPMGIIPAIIGRMNLWSKQFHDSEAERERVEEIEQVPCCPTVTAVADVIKEGATPSNSVSFATPIVVSRVRPEGFEPPTLGSEDRSNHPLPMLPYKCQGGSTGAIETVPAMSRKVVGLCQSVSGWGSESTLGTYSCCPFRCPPHSNDQLWPLLATRLPPLFWHVVCFEVFGVPGSLNKLLTAVPRPHLLGSD